jgi:uncharacterized protein with gpF-like domain
LLETARRHNVRPVESAGVQRQYQYRHERAQNTAYLYRIRRQLVGVLARAFEVDVFQLVHDGPAEMASSRIIERSGLFGYGVRRVECGFDGYGG